MKYPQSTISHGLGQRLAQLRQMKGLSQADIVQDELSRAYVSAVERGRITPSLQALELIASRLGEPISVLLGEAATTVQGVGPATGVLQVEQRLFTLVTVPGGSDIQRLIGELENAPADAGYEAEILRLYTLARALLIAGRVDSAIGEARRGLDLVLTNRRVGRELWQMWFDVLLANAYLEVGQTASAVDLFGDLTRRLGNGVEGGERQDRTLRISIGAGHLASLRTLGQTERATTIAAGLEPMLPTSLIEAVTAFYMAPPGSPSTGQTASGPWSSRLIFAKLIEHLRVSARAWEELAAVRERGGDVDRAESDLSHAVDLAEVSGALDQAANAVNSLAAIRLDANKLDVAADAARRGAALAERQPSGWVRGKVASTLARVAAAQGSTDEALGLYQDAITRMEGAGRTTGKELSETYFAYGRLLVSQGRVEEGVRLLERAYVATQRGEARP